MRMIGSLCLLMGMGIHALALVNPTVPEIDAGSAVSALALLGGAVLILRARRKK